MDKTISQVISEFLSFLSQAQSDYAFSQEEIVRLDMLTQDYLHKLELQDTNYRDRAKMATDLRQCRIDRRYHKDHVANLAPLVQCLTSDKGKVVLSQLQQTLGAVRKAERATQDRHYTPRVLSQEEYNGNQQTS